MSAFQTAASAAQLLFRDNIKTAHLVWAHIEHDARFVVQECRLFWQILDSEEAHFVYAFVGVAIGWLAIQCIKGGRAARRWFDGQMANEESELKTAIHAANLVASQVKDIIGVAIARAGSLGDRSSREFQLNYDPNDIWRRTFFRSTALWLGLLGITRACRCRLSGNNCFSGSG